jgi:hypothetical protein
MMFRHFETGGEQWWPAPRRIDRLDTADWRLLWALRRLALMQPIGAARCHAVHIALQQDFGEHGLGIEHLLRCLLVGLSRRADRQLVFGEPACALLLPDEAALLAALRSEARDCEAALAALAGPQAAALLPLVAGLNRMTQNIFGSLLAKCDEDISWNA